MIAHSQNEEEETVLPLASDGEMLVGKGQFVNILIVCMTGQLTN